MENKEVKIIPPEGYCIDEANSTLNCIKFRPESLTYKDVVEQLLNKNPCQGDTFKDVSDIYSYTSSKLQCRKLIAINQLMNVAKYLNGNWKPDFKKKERAWYFYIGCDNKVLIYHNDINETVVYFKTMDLAEQAIRILGADTVRLALSTNW